MVHSNMKKLAVLAAVLGVTVCGEAFAADVTDVLDAADEVYLENQKVSDPFDISLTPKFVQHYEWAKLKREYNDAGNIRLLNEAKYERVINKMDIDLEIGLFHDLSLRVSAPVIISDQVGYKFDSVNRHDPITGEKLDTMTTAKDDSYFAGNTSVAPAGAFIPLVDGETLKGQKRSGFGDMKFGIAWSPYNTERHFIPERPWENNTGRSTVTLAFDYVAPTGKAKDIYNDAVGSGAHEFIFSVAASHRFDFVDPYIRLQYGLPVGTDDMYKKVNDNQARVDPGMWGRVDLGIEFIPYESLGLKFQRQVKIDLRGYFKYTAEGRAYSELADGFAQGDCISSDGVAANGKCSWLASKWANAGVENMDNMASNKFSDLKFKEDGMFDYEGFATVGGAINLTVQPVQWVSIVAGVAADYTQNHFITFTKVGKDRGNYQEKTNQSAEKDGVVSLDSVQERNPVYSEALDAVGKRIKRTESLNLEWFIGLKLAY